MIQDSHATGFVEVRLGALGRNYEKLRDGTNSGDSGAEVGAVVKANAYGLGAAQVSRRLFEHGCRKFFVATTAEGVALRSELTADGGAEIYVFEGMPIGSEQVLLEHALMPVLNTRRQIEAWSKIDAPCAVHVDTGMGRLGIDVDEWGDLCSDSALHERLDLRYLMTHLACADKPDNPQNIRQLERFEAARAHCGDVKVSIANSAGAFLDQRFHGDLIRPGIALYGGNPFSEHENPMETVVSLQARILQLREVTRSTTVGYGATYEAPAGSVIATVGVGYADGYPRELGNNALAALRGIRVPVIGRVSMDLTCLDVADAGRERVAVGDYVEMFGDHVSVDEIAALCSTISYEILAGLNARLLRRYVD